MRLLLIDTCGDEGSFALAEDGAVLCERTLPPRTASAQLVSELRTELVTLGWRVGSLGGVGVVSGPGSFTGVRVGMAAAKGLCEVGGIALATISRLELLLLAGRAVNGDCAVLDAGRGEFYVRAAVEQEELLMGRDELPRRFAGGQLLISEDRLKTVFDGYPVTLVRFSAADVLSLAERDLKQGGESVDSADANYVRQARGLYASPQGAECAPGA